MFKRRSAARLRRPIRARCRCRSSSSKRLRFWRATLPSTRYWSRGCTRIALRPSAGRQHTRPSSSNTMVRRRIASLRPGDEVSRLPIARRNFVALSPGDGRRDMDQDYRQRCSDLATLILRFTAADGLHHAPVPGVHCARYSKTDRPTKRQWRACLAIVAQGCKEVVVGLETFAGKAGQFTAAPIHLPVISRVAAATPEKPFLALLIDLEPRVLNEAAAHFEAVALQESAPPVLGFFRGTATPQMLDSSVRLPTLSHRPAAPQALRPP